jgi:L-aminopeptidase/D-esterase-like protein
MHSCSTDSFSVSGFQLGHWTDEQGGTGCTVLLADSLVPAAVDIRGGSPGTRETDLLDAGKSVQRLDAVVLTGGSAFGLASTEGVVRWLYEKDRGFPTAATPVPIVAGAVIYDLVPGQVVWPDADAGYRAVSAASSVWEGGRIGAGRGASVSKILGREHAHPSGVGVAQVECPAGIVSAVFVNNAFGDVWPAGDARPRTFPGGGARSSEEVILNSDVDTHGVPNTVIGAVTVSRPLNHHALTRIAIAGQAGVAQSIRPAHTPVDGDTVFALSTAEGECSARDLMQLTTTAQIAVTAAMLSSISGD